MSWALNGQVRDGAWRATTPGEQRDLIASGATAEAVLRWGARGADGARDDHERDLDERVFAARFGDEAAP